MLVMINGECRTAQNRTAGNGPDALKSVETLNSRQRAASGLACELDCVAAD